MTKFESCIYTGPALECVTPTSMFAPVEVASNYVGLLGDASVRVTGRADGIKRVPGAKQSREIEQLQQSGRRSRCPCD